MTDILEEIQKQKDQGKDLTAEQLILMEMIKIRNTLYKVEIRLETVEKSVEKSQAFQEHYPSITWLLRYRTKDTIGWIVFLFVILSLWFVSGFREPILRFFGFPIF